MAGQDGSSSHRGPGKEGRTASPTNTLAHNAYSRLVRMVASGELRKLGALSHRGLAERLGMSTQPVRLAVRQLEQEGVLESIPRVGTRIRHLGAEDFWGQLRWRIALEVEVARLASVWMDASKHEQVLREQARLADEHIAADMSDLHEVDTGFHLHLAGVCGAPRLRDELQRLNIYHLKMAACEAVDATSGTSKSPDPPPTHAELTTAILSGDPETAGNTMRRHLECADQVYGFTQWYQRTHLNRGSAVE